MPAEIGRRGILAGPYCPGAKPLANVPGVRFLAGKFAGGEWEYTIRYVIASSWISDPPPATASKAGLLSGRRGTHTSRTLMLAELRELLSSVAVDARRDEFDRAIIESNVLGKATTSGRRLTNQRLGELYGLDPGIPVFRVLRRLWSVDEAGRPLLALLCALARDPLLRVSADAVLPIAPGAELMREPLLAVLRKATGTRLSDATLEKVARNVASSWSQSGHLVGRMRKVRRLVEATPASVAFAVWLGSLQGLHGEDLIRTPWTRVLDQGHTALLALALRAKQLGLAQVRTVGSVVEIDVRGLDPLARST